MSFRACGLAGAGRLETGRGSWKGFQIHCSSISSPTAAFCMNQGLKNPAACLFVRVMRFEPISPMILIWQGGLKDSGYPQVSQKRAVKQRRGRCPSCVCTCVCAPLCASEPARVCAYIRVRVQRSLDIRNPDRRTEKSVLTSCSAHGIIPCSIMFFPKSICLVFLPPSFSF